MAGHEFHPVADLFPLMEGKEFDDLVTDALVDSLCIGRKLDYFSREARPGWEQYGDEPGKFEGAA